MLSGLQKIRTLVYFWACQMLESLWERGQHFQNLVMWLEDPPASARLGIYLEMKTVCFLYGMLEMTVHRLGNRLVVARVEWVWGRGWGWWIHEGIINRWGFKGRRGGSSQPWNCSVYLHNVDPTDLHRFDKVNRAEYTQHTHLHRYTNIHRHRHSLSMHLPNFPLLTYAFSCRHHDTFNQKYTHVQTHMCTPRHTYTHKPQIHTYAHT